MAGRSQPRPAVHPARVARSSRRLRGYDATVTDIYSASALAAARRGFHRLLFDGPGQGEMLYERGIRLRRDRETVVQSVVDLAITLPVVDTTRIALSGRSLGGYLARRRRRHGQPDRAFRRHSDRRQGSCLCARKLTPL
jgi:hypothetical protein